MAQNIQIKTENEEGTVIIHAPVFRRLIEETVHGFSDDIRIAKYKGDIPDWIQKVTGTEYLDSMDFTEENGRLRIVLYLIVRDGMDFEKSAYWLIDALKQKIFDRTGVIVSSVELIVTATFTTNRIIDMKDVSYRD